MKSWVVLPMNSRISGYGNKRMLFGVLVALFGIFLLWYWFHPLSPHHKRLAYVAVFDEVGPLAKGSNVKVGGVPKGRILGLQKTDSCIYVRFEVASDFPLPKDSRLHFASSGFLGDRDLAVEPGTSSAVFSSGDTIRNAVFDKGLNTARDDLDLAMKELSAVSALAKGLLDSLEKGSVRKDGERVVRKGKRLLADADESLSEIGGKISGLLDGLSATAEKLEKSLSEVSRGAELAKDSGESLVSRLEDLSVSAENARGEWERVLGLLDGNDNSAGLLLQKGGEVSGRIESIGVRADSLIRSVKKNGLNLNIDIF